MKIEVATAGDVAVEGDAAGFQVLHLMHSDQILHFLRFLRSPISCSTSSFEARISLQGDSSGEDEILVSVTLVPSATYGLSFFHMRFGWWRRRAAPSPFSSDNFTD